MARGSDTSNQPVVGSAYKWLDQFKYETARELGINPPQDGYWGDIPSRQNGAVGGHMVKKMIEFAERNLSGQGGTTR